ncbi:MAG: hypothetical protein ACJAX7_001779 [Saprospiraceae bacterium]
MNDQSNFSPRIIFEEEVDGFKIIYNLPVDIDNDGDIDVVSGGYHDNIEWFENLDGLGNFGEEQIITINNLDILKEINAADLDGDGDMDVLSASRNDGKIAWYENINGQGTFGEQQLISSPEELYGFSVVAADIDNDGDMDVVSGRGDDYVSWYENLDGLGNFSMANIISTEADGVLQVLITDINDDGKIDVLSSSYWDSEIAWYENLGNLSTQDLDFFNLNIYPNPTHEFINISFQNEILINSVTIYDVLGRELFIINNPSNQINISTLTDGLLFVQLETEKGIIVEKIIKQ